MANKNLTVFQRLGQILGPDTATKKQIKQTQKYNIGKSELIRTTDKAEYDAAKLQAMQNKHLGQVWKKVESGLFQQAMNYETTRIGSYSDFEAMEFYPTIAAALDVMMEESTTLNDKGRMLNVYSESTRVKSILEDLFYNRLDLHTTLPMYCRNMCKYGDNFVYLNIDDKHGILGGKQMPNYEMERTETGLFDMITGRNLAYNNAADSNPNSGDKVKFVWRANDVVFNSWQIAHFRLLGDDRRLPYGTSVLEKARRIWKQLILSEDSMLVYRITRAPERRVYKIYVGNMDDADVGQYVNQIADRFKRMPITDPQTGQIDLRYNMMANDQDYFIPVRSEDAPNPIDVLPGAANLDQIADIEYLQRNLFTALRVPKPFLGFEEATGDGKNLAVQDIRFSRTINRIQQSMIQELNKIAIIHLYILGFEDDLDNFTLTLNNPSTQAEMLKIEHTQQKVTLFKDATSDLGNGFAPMSMTRAHREIMGWSDDEIKQDLLEQRMEKAAAAEFSRTASVIKHTGMFDKVDRIYGDMEAALNGGGDEGAEGGEDTGGAGGGGGSFGGGGLGGEDLDFSGEGDDAGTDGEDIAATDETGAEGDMGADVPVEEPTDTLSESVNRFNKKLNEEKHILDKKLKARTQKYQNIYFNKLLESVNSKSVAPEEKLKMYDQNIKVNEDINNMIKGIDKILDE